MDDEIRIVTPEELEEDQLSVRPQSLNEYIGIFPFILLKNMI